MSPAVHICQIVQGKFFDSFPTDRMVMWQWNSFYTPCSVPISFHTWVAPSTSPPIQRNTFIAGNINDGCIDDWTLRWRPSHTWVSGTGPICKRMKMYNIWRKLFPAQWRFRNMHDVLTIFSRAVNSEFRPRIFYKKKTRNATYHTLKKMCWY